MPKNLNLPTISLSETQLLAMSTSVEPQQQQPIGTRPVKGPILSIPKRAPPDFTLEDTDNLPGAQFTTFEAKKPPKEPQKPVEISVKRMSEVVDLPDSVPHTKLTVDSEKVVCFSGRGHWLSNFHRSLARIDGNEYPSVEHYYQACKLYMLAGARYSAQLRRIPDPGQVKVTARRLLKGIVTEPQIDQWKIREGPRLIEYGMMHKFVQNPKLRSQLLETGDAILVHCYDRDKIFASNINKDSFQTWAKENNGKVLKIPSELSPETLPYYPLIGDGKNIAGLIAMRVRDQIRRYVESLDGAGGSGLGDPGFDAVLSAALSAVSLNVTEGEKQEEKAKEPEKKEVVMKKKDNRYLE